MTFATKDFIDARIGIIGLGYVGLPLAVAFSEVANVVGFDLDVSRITDLINGIDRTLEVTETELASVNRIEFTNNPDVLRKCNVYIITVPTPIDQFNRPDLRALVDASKLVGRILKSGDTVIYESTVYPGATEEDCVPEIESISGLKLNQDFFVGYSPERINPGDRSKRLRDICKVTSGSNDETAKFVDGLYKKIIHAGTHPAPSIRVAEAANVIENTQRDVNIALINELAIIFGHMDIDTSDVLSAAGSKWNFLPFRPGLVGGHCIGIDPFYLTHKAYSFGYRPEIVLAGRNINENMARYVASQFVKGMLKKCSVLSGARVLVLGITFKEDCPDIRNSKVFDLVKEMTDYGIKVDLHDPWADEELVLRQYGLNINQTLKEKYYDGILIAVNHSEFTKLGIAELRKFGRETCYVYDLKSAFPKDDVDERL